METRETKTNLPDGFAGFSIILVWLAFVGKFPRSRCKLSSNPKAWPDAVRLAFGFLDVDRDGFLSASDLLAHVAGEDGLRLEMGGNDTRPLGQWINGLKLRYLVWKIIKPFKVQTFRVQWLSEV